MPSRLTLLDVMVLAAVVVAGLINLAQPFHGDQAIFTLASGLWAEGGALYRDFWDLKQPGIHTFYLVGGSLFGFNEAGVHAFELLYWVVFAVVICVSIKSYFRYDRFATLVPLLTVGYYYAVATSFHLTQIEALIGFPLYMTLWLAVPPGRAAPESKMRFLLSGLMGGVVFGLKMVYLTIPLCFWTIAFVRSRRFHRHSPGWELRTIVLPITIGFLVPVALIVVYFYSQGTLGLLWWTAVVYPGLAMSAWGPSLGTLAGGVTWFVATYSPLLALATIAGYAWFESERDAFGLGLMFWFFAGLGLIAIQTLSWWQYHYLLLGVPTGILAAKGLDAVWSARVSSGARKRIEIGVMVIVVALLLAPAGRSLALKAAYLAADGYAIEESQRHRYQARLSSDYERIRDEVSFLTEPGSLPGDVYVFGNPLYLYLSGRDQAIPINGWSFDILIPEQWAEVVAGLDRERPAYVFVQKNQIPFIRDRYPAANEFLARRYQVLSEVSGGTWYVIRDGEGT